MVIKEHVNQCKSGGLWDREVSYIRLWLRDQLIVVFVSLLFFSWDFLTMTKIHQTLSDTLPAPRALVHIVLFWAVPEHSYNSQ